MLLLENISHKDLKEYMKEFYNYALEKLNIDRTPKIIFKKNKSNANDILGKTGYYDPEEETIFLFITDRHAKDVLRSFAHELIHHEQKCRGDDEKIDLSLTATDPSYSLHNEELREMEREAFERGNMLFRDWCDTKKMERKNIMAESKDLVELVLEKILLRLKEVDIPSKKEKEYRHQTGLEIKKLKGKRGIEDKGAYAGKIAKMKLGITKQEMEEEAKPDFLDLDKDGNKEEPMKKAAQDAKKLKKEDDSYPSSESVESLQENETVKNPYPELLNKKERLFSERFSEYEQWKFEELLKRAINKK